MAGCGDPVKLAILESLLDESEEELLIPGND
jgi:hypothetical protein